MFRRPSFARFEYRPCLVTACRIRSIPSAVFAPVDNPPCNLHLPFRIAGHRHKVPARVFAPHRGAFNQSPGGLPFFNQPRFSWGDSFIFDLPPYLPLYPLHGVHVSDNRFSTIMNVNMLHRYFLLSGLAL